MAAFAAAGGRALIDAGSLVVDGLPSLFPGLSVLNMRLLFSGDGVRESLVALGGPGDSEGLGWEALFILLDSVEAFLG